jgi:hypothetical protein
LTTSSGRITKAAEPDGLLFFAGGVNPDTPVQACLKPNETADEHGYRHLTFNTYLNPLIVNARMNRLKIYVNSVVKKFHTQYNEQGKLGAQGVFVNHDKATSSNKLTYFFKARREVSLFAGVIASP